MSSFADFLAGVVLSLLPPRYRRWYPYESNDFVRGAIASGLLQTLGCSGIYIGRYLIFVQGRAQFGIGFVSVVEYVLSPVSLLLAYFTIEGALRLTGAIVSQQVLGTLPLHLVAMLHERFDRQRAERALGERVPDTVERVKEDDEESDVVWRIASCRPKPRWNSLMTISYEDELYEVAEQLEGEPPRRFVYLLRKMPKGKIVRGLHHYHPDEALEQDPAG